MNWRTKDRQNKDFLQFLAKSRCRHEAVKSCVEWSADSIEALVAADRIGSYLFRTSEILVKQR